MKRTTYPVYDHTIPFTLGARRVFTAKRKLARLSFSLEDTLNGTTQCGSTLPDRCEGMRVLSAPVGQMAAIRGQFPELGRRLITPCTRCGRR